MPDVESGVVSEGIFFSRNFLHIGAGRAFAEPFEERTKVTFLAFGFRVDRSIRFVANKSMEAEFACLLSGGGPKKDSLDTAGYSDVEMLHAHMGLNLSLPRCDE